uniref:Uncharacterized protein n=1 Tax=Arundo donax TaxID=35708 RepID=A0A0A9CQF6_ARUDO
MWRRAVGLAPFPGGSSARWAAAQGAAPSLVLSLEEKRKEAGQSNGRAGSGADSGGGDLMVAVAFPSSVRPTCAVACSRAVRLPYPSWPPLMPLARLLRPPQLVHAISDIAPSLRLPASCST